ncbi:unnamed protein product [Diatraea saccharalis]|uniref:Uncharacterized protein n=1 Tax=Diatraea saccharalis TaxID=40085 RepID=A0A9N9WJM3_9NEOP|nr:unnamed protein product [Diatraea saccharalis]
MTYEDGITSHRQARSTDGSPARVSLFPISSNPAGSSSNLAGSLSKSAGTLANPTVSLAKQAGSRSSSSRTNTSLKSPAAGTDRGTRQADDIPVFDRNKVSLDFPGSMFGPTLSLLIRTTKIVGDVIQNSAVRYQTFLRLFRPLFRGPFEIKGLDPATTTTTTTTTTTAAPAKTSDNEIRR